MADVDRRGCSDKKQGADEAKENTVETRGDQGIEVNVATTTETIEVSVISNSTPNHGTTQSEIEAHSDASSLEIMSSTSIENSEVCGKLDENIEAKLLKAREELSRARDELAQAKTEVQKAKQELTSAEADTNQSSESCSESVSKPEDDSQKEDVQIEGHQPSDEQITEVSTSVNTDSDSAKSGKDASLEPVVSGIKVPEDLETAVPESQKEETILHEEQSNQGDNQNEGEMKSADLSAMEVTDENKIVEASDSTCKKEISHNEEIPEENQERTDPSDLDDEANVDEHEEEDAEEEEHSDEDDDVLVEGEREEGDGEESENTTPKALDDDEDRRNPQYIPKRGGFYEHDDRTREEGEEPQPVAPVSEEKPKKGSRSEVTERWGHDMFDEHQQGPKSEQELRTLYGYDIRKEEGAPRARRRRRYGRGPNKYSRAWEDEDAYTKSSHPRSGGSARGGATPKSVAEDSNSGTILPENESKSGPSHGEDEIRSDGYTKSGDSRGRGTSRGGKEFRGGSTHRGGGESRGGISRGGPRGGGRGRFRETENIALPRNEDFPPLNTFKADEENISDITGGASSTNWRENTSRDARGGGVAISFRRGGGGRTFEERNSVKAVKGRGDHMEYPSHFEEKKLDDAPNFDSQMRDGKRSIRGAGTPRGGPPSRGFSRGGRGSVTGGESRNWLDMKGREAETGEQSGSSPRSGGGPHSSGGPQPSVGSQSSFGPHQPTSHASTTSRSSGGSSFVDQGKSTSFHNTGEHRPRGGGRPSGRIPASSIDMSMANIQRMHLEDSAPMSGPQNRPQDAANATRSKRYSSQRQRMTSSPPPPTGGVVMQSPYVPNVGSGYYAPYNDSPPPNYPPSTYPDTSAPLLPLVGTQGAPPPFMAAPLAFPGAPAPASFNAGFQGYPPAPAPPQAGVPIGTPTQEGFAGGIMYYDTGRQTNRHASQPMRRAKAAIPIVAPDTDVDNLLASGGRYIHD